MLKKKCIEYCMNFKYFDSHIIGFLSICIFALKNIPVYSLYILPKEFIAQKSYIPLSDIFSAFTAKWPILILVDVKELLDIAFWGSCVWMGCHLFHIALSRFQNDEPCLCNFPSILSKLDRSKMMMMKVNSWSSQFGYLFFWQELGFQVVVPFEGYRKRPLTLGYLLLVFQARSTSLPRTKVTHTTHVLHNIFLKQEISWKAVLP